MSEVGPCMQMSVGLHVFIVFMNVVQSVAIAYLAQRAARKNREDKNGISGRY